MSQVRVQRTDDWKPSKSAVWVGPRSKFYNPFAAKLKGYETGRATMTRQYLVNDFKEWLTKPLLWRRTAKGWAWVAPGNWDSMLGVPYADREAILNNLEMLRGKDLVCRCPITQPCHADVLLEVANEPPAG